MLRALRARGLGGSGVPVAHAQGEEVLEGEGAEQEYRNALNFGFIYTHSILREQETLPGEGARGSENLYGFKVSYERVSIPSHLAFVVAKPFVFTRERYDSPLELLLKGLFRKGAWEPFLAAGISNNIRTFAREREELEGKRVEYAFGVARRRGLRTSSLLIGESSSSLLTSTSSTLEASRSTTSTLRSTASTTSNEASARNANEEDHGVPSGG